MKKKIFLTTLVLLVSMMQMQITVYGETTDKFTSRFEYEQNVFTDISGNEWYADNVKKCYEFGLMKGKRDGFFDAGGNVTLAEAISMASRTHEIYNGGDGVIENTGTNWYDGAVNYAADNGIITKWDFNNYNLPATREQLAYIFANILPESEFIVLNNIGRIPDLNVVGPYDKSIYYLYRAGILTGNDKFGTFYRESNITRAEVATLIIRIVSPEDRITFSKDAVIYPGNNPNFEKYEFKYITNGYPGETKDLIDTNNIQVYGVFDANSSMPNNLEYLDEIKTTDLPKNSEMYPYILSGIDNEIYEMPFFSSYYNDPFGPIKSYEKYFEDYYSMEAMIRQAYEEILNIDYETISKISDISFTNANMFYAFGICRNRC